MNIHRVSNELSDMFELSDTMHLISYQEMINPLFSLFISIVFSGKMRMLWVIHHLCEFQALTNHMEVEYSGGGVLIFSYLILIHQFDNFGGLR